MRRRLGSNTRVVSRFQTRAGPYRGGRRWRIPDTVAGREAYGMKPSRVRVRCVEIRDREICVIPVDGRSPLHSAEAAAFACPILPDHASLLIGVERPSNAGFLPDDD